LVEAREAFLLHGNPETIHIGETSPMLRLAGARRRRNYSFLVVKNRPMF
jgi:hypothetical protein